MMKDMEGLHSAELELENLQKQLEQARMEQESVTTEKQNLEKRLMDEAASGMHTSYSDLEVSQLKQEVEVRGLFRSFLFITRSGNDKSDHLFAEFRGWELRFWHEKYFAGL